MRRAIIIPMLFHFPNSTIPAAINRQLSIVADLPEPGDSPRLIMNLYPFIRSIQGVDVGTQNASRNLVTIRIVRTRGRPREAEITAEDKRKGRMEKEGTRWPRGFPARIAERFRDRPSVARERPTRQEDGRRATRDI